MADELETIAAGPETATEPRDEPQVIGQDTPEVETDEPERIEAPEDDFEEFDWNGKKVKAPKGLKDGVLMQADYTRKTQEVAAERRELEQKAQALAQQTQASDEELSMRADLRAVEREIDRLSRINWQEATSQDLVAAQSEWMRFTQLKEAATSLRGALHQSVTQRTAQAEQELANRMQETQRYAETKIPGWTPDVDVKIMDFATKELGFDLPTLRQAVSPQVYRALHLAWIGSQTLNKPTAPKPAAPQPTAPLTVVSSKANPNARKPLAEMSMDEFVAARKAGRVS